MANETVNVKTIKTRIQNKHDIEVNWFKATGFVPFEGELLIYDAETQDTFDAAYSTLNADQKAAFDETIGRTAPITYTRVKIGNGKDIPNDLAFIDDHLKEEIKDFIKAIPDEYVTDEELNAKGYLTEHQPLDDYAKKSDIPEVPVKSVNNKTGAITLTAADVGALSSSTTLADLSGDETHRTVTDAEKAAWNAKSTFSGDYNDLDNKPEIPSIANLATEEYVTNAVTSVKELLEASKADKEHTHPELMSVGTADPDENITSQFYFKYSTD